MFLAEALHPLGNVDVAVVGDAGERDGAIALGSEKLEAARLDPIVDHGVQSGVASVAGFDALGENVVELRLQRVDQRNAWRAGRHVLLLVFGEFHEVEIVAAIAHRFGAFHGALGDGEQRETRRERKGFLAAGQQDIDAEFIHRNRQGGKGRNGIHDQHDLREFTNDGGDFLERVQNAAGGFVVNERDGVETALGELFAHLLRPDRLTPLDLQSLGLLAAALGDIEPLVGKRTAHAVQNFFGNQIADRAFHHAPGGGGGEKDRAGGSEKRLQAGLDAAIEFFEIAAAVADHRTAHRTVGFFGDLDRAGNEKLGVVAL